MALPSPAPQLRRVESMLEQLDRTVAEYITAKDQFDSTRIAYEVAREKFAGVRRLAASVLSSTDWWSWRYDHANVRYTGLKISDAIVEALQDRAFTAAEIHHNSGGKKPYQPGMNLEELQDAMERGGFEFRTATPLREVNAALIQLDRTRVTKDEKMRLYRLADADEILEMLRPPVPPVVRPKEEEVPF